MARKSVPRPQQNGPDIGAYEWFPDQLHITVLNPPGFMVEFDVIPGPIYHLLGSGDLQHWTQLQSFGPYSEQKTISWPIPNPTESQAFRLEIYFPSERRWEGVSAR